MVDYFIFPYSFEDILKSSDERYCVNPQESNKIKVSDEKKIKIILSKFEEAFIDDYKELKTSEK